MSINYAIDVSFYDARRWVGLRFVYDRPTNWLRARDESNISLAIIKCSEAIYKDKGFDIQWEAAKPYLPRVAYHFFRSNFNAIKQAELVRDILIPDWTPHLMQRLPDTNFVMLDLETLDNTNPVQVLKNAGSFLFETEKYCRPDQIIIYTRTDIWKSIGGESAIWAKKYKLMAAQYTFDKWIVKNSPNKLFDAARMKWLKEQIEGGLKPDPIPPWDKADIWQITARADPAVIAGHPGLKKAVDFSAVYMDIPPLVEAPIEPPVVIVP